MCVLTVTAQRCNRACICTPSLPLSWIRGGCHALGLRSGTCRILGVHRMHALLAQYETVSVQAIRMGLCEVERLNIGPGLQLANA